MSMPKRIMMPRLLAPGLLTVVLLALVWLAAGCTPVVPPPAASNAGDAAAATATTEEATALEVSAEDAGVCTINPGGVAVLLPDRTSSPRWEMDDRRFFDEALTAAAVPYTIFNAQGDAVTQRAQAQQALADGAQVLILVNLDSRSGAAIIADARAAGAHVIDYDRLTVAGPGADLYVSFDNVGVGSLMGQTLEPLINGLDAELPRVVQLNGADSDNNATLVRVGYSSVATPYYDQGKWQLAADRSVPDWDPAQAGAIFSEILAEGGDGSQVDAVFAANDVLAGAVVQVLKRQGLPPVLLSGQDATVEGLQNILAGWQTMTVYKPIQKEVAAAVDAAVALLNCGDVNTLETNASFNNGERDIPFIKLDSIAVTKENIGETVVANGLRSWDELCSGEYAQFCPPADQR